MISTAEEIIENIRLLPKTEREKVFKLIESEKSQETVKDEELKRRNEKFQLALKWVEDHKDEFDGQWVVLDGDNLISHGTDSKKVCDEARAKGIETPFLKRVKAKVLPWGGW
jgi:hypothetical protein